VIGAALTLALATPAAADMRTYGSDDAFRQGWESGERRDAQQFLASMPSVETLMPVLDVATLGPLAPLAIPRHEERGRGGFEEY
jgi:hypothetical protein